ncbi:cytidine deaminase [Acetivibrio mesophilus]|uniref:Cytidine deaminase n=1 Tax=Acetivibrio mesophilus TaxID=2487273 RepID=A0A4Q0I686_9FIRM|nr:cytidine deaminase [Acetivibrio mesophilus]ODM25093.1 cytidine deaminase [Clostridium sp. Bc-iso-3]RXE59904.1 cytidine deaminase [Acetivibrio mesophilus]HHV29679.1 cytidine deaminase [Clostridium sp.]
MDDRKLLTIAENIKENSYSPYSNFRVGAAVLTESGKTFAGVNVENASFGATICAERTAVFKAVSEGERKIMAVAISSDSDDYTFPCGICRQVLAEFGADDTRVICGNRNGEFKVFRLGELLPNAFLKF